MNMSKKKIMMNSLLLKIYTIYVEILVKLLKGRSHFFLLNFPWRNEFIRKNFPMQF